MSAGYDEIILVTFTGLGTDVEILISGRGGVHKSL
jgi:hypothetical protein